MRSKSDAANVLCRVDDGSLGDPRTIAAKSRLEYNGPGMVDPG